MDFNHKFISIRDFLSTYSDIWSDEIINIYPHGLNPYKTSWINSLLNLDEEALWKLDAKVEIPNSIDPELKSLLQKIEGLEVMEKAMIPSKRVLEDWAYFKVKEKKKHEIDILAPMIKDYFEKGNFERVIDIGGGIGHLARTLAHYYGIPTISLDMDLNFQEIGKKRAVKFPLPKDAAPLQFLNHKFGGEEDKQLDIFNEKSLVLGLHTCGPLALSVLDALISKGCKSILSFGCCYLKMDNSDTHLSKLSKENPLYFSKYALTLATRGHGPISLEEFRLKRKVKAYRYALHILFFEKLGKEEFYSVGDSHPREYDKPFSEYVKSKCDFLNIPYEFNDNEVNAFFNEPRIQNILEQMFVANAIRWHFGRLLELYILLDRAIFLQEQGATVQLSEYFDVDLSPRNIGLLATIR